jgi:hypothetical protein
VPQELEAQELEVQGQQVQGQVVIKPLEVALQPVLEDEGYQN